MKNSKSQTTMKSILKVKTKSFLENYKENRIKDTLLKEINIVEDGEKQIKELIKEGTITDNLLIESIKNVMKERINNV
tara:strand:- start:3291 stop:3524 length:234 start_codon:yes stop_codon:yes gene_type:complete